MRWASASGCCRGRSCTPRIDSRVTGRPRVNSAIRRIDALVAAFRSRPASSGERAAIARTGARTVIHSASVSCSQIARRMRRWFDRASRGAIVPSRRTLITDRTCASTSGETSTDVGQHRPHQRAELFDRHPCEERRGELFLGRGPVHVGAQAAQAAVDERRGGDRAWLVCCDLQRDHGAPRVTGHDRPAQAGGERHGEGVGADVVEPVAPVGLRAQPVPAGVVGHHAEPASQIAGACGPRCAGTTRGRAASGVLGNRAPAPGKTRADRRVPSDPMTVVMRSSGILAAWQSAFRSPLAPDANDGAVAIVTGGGTGIGRATALEFARTGARVAICGRRSEPIEAVRREIEATGQRRASLPPATCASPRRWQPSWMRSTTGSGTSTCW